MSLTRALAKSSRLAIGLLKARYTSETVNAGGLSDLRIPKSVCRFNTSPGDGGGSMSMREERDSKMRVNL